MSERRYWRLLVLLPMVLPILVVGADLGWRCVIIGDCSQPQIPPLLAFLAAASVVVGGPPYILFALLAFYILRRVKLPTVRRWLLAAPIIYGALFAMLWGPLLLALPTEAYDDYGELGMAMSLVIGVGYLYVVGGCIGRWIGHRAGLIVEPT